jgi:hypothetical protein
VTRFAAASLLVLLAACDPPRDAPDLAYRRFAAAFEKGDRDAVWALLDHGSRAAYEKAAAAVAKAEGRTTVDPKAVAFGTPSGYPAVDARKLKSVEVVDVKGDQATVVVVDEKDARQTVPLRREDGAWRVSVEGFLPVAP